MVRFTIILTNTNFGIIHLHVTNDIFTFQPGAKKQYVFTVAEDFRMTRLRNMQISIHIEYTSDTLRDQHLFETVKNCSMNMN
jgi:hypothetical protein